MLITIRRPWILRLFGWKTFPSTGVKANWRLWWFWFNTPPSSNGQGHPPLTRKTGDRSPSGAPFMRT
jgi:hypothetical protein